MCLLLAFISDRVAFGKRYDKVPLVKYFTAEEFGLTAEPISSGKYLKGFIYKNNQAVENGKIIVLCHGMGPGHIAYTTDIAYFCNLGYTVAAFDGMGCNFSDGRNIKGMYEGISRCLRIIAARVEAEQGEQQEYFTVKTLDIVRHIPLSDILYFATSGRTHRIELHASRERLDFLGSIKELEEQLGESFLRVHRAYLVQVSQIGEADFKNRELVLKNGERCPFSRDARQKLRALFAREASV